mmetsp:Transcript_15036/g.30419  ORF Transcript_15036/g.30419 Transcript_15036/m.30419 type:complete len:88 (+) Transcript_15036:2835-3098(+)
MKQPDDVRVFSPLLRTVLVVVAHFWPNKLLVLEETEEIARQTDKQVKVLQESQAGRQDGFFLPRKDQRTEEKEMRKKQKRRKQESKN